ncbi:hypothetical protein [Vibrio splendidus]|uniref:hypothetical protein n=1 Tax=Vibrio cyclitrophicus TaxID=47951 RepID=UPI0035512106
MGKIRKNSWDGIGKELFSRLGNAIKSLQFIAFFLVGIILIGGIGIWLPYFTDKSGAAVLFESQNVFTYAVAILGTLVVEGFFGNKQKSLAALGLISGVLAFLLCSIGYYKLQTGLSIWVNIGAILSLLLFLLANVNDDRFDDEEEESTSSSTGYSDANAAKIVDK